MNYQLGADLSRNDVATKGIAPPDTENFSLHGQTTFVSQYAFPFRAPYSGQNSLASNAGRETFDLDFYVGFRPWDGGEIWIDPEIDQGFGLITPLLGAEQTSCLMSTRIAHPGWNAPERLARTFEVFCDRQSRSAPLRSPPRSA